MSKPSRSGAKVEHRGERGYLQYAYITCSDKEGDEPFTEMLVKLAELSFKPAMDVKIIVGSSDAADKIRRLAEAGFNQKVFRTERNIHNKGIVVDGAARAGEQRKLVRRRGRL